MSKTKGTPTEKRGLRLDGYVRVSAVAGREGDSYITEDVQAEKIRGWIELHDHKLGEMRTDRNISGGVLDRPGLTEILTRIEQGDSDGVVVYNISRFSRNIENTVSLLGRIRDRGALFASVQEQFDLSTWQGRMVFNILQSIAEGERERIGENWSIAGAKAVGRGVPPQRMAFGYRKRDDGRWEPDPDTAWVVTELFKRRARREPWLQLSEWLAETGVTPRYGGAWTKTTVVRGMIRSRAYLGEITYEGRVYENMHEPLTDSVTWLAAQGRGPRSAAGVSPSRLLSGLCRCAGCRYMTAATDKHGGYRCKRAQSAGDCPAPVHIAGFTTEAVGGGRSRINGVDLAGSSDGAAAGPDRIVEVFERDGTSVERFKAVIGPGRDRKADAPVRAELVEKLIELRELGAGNRATARVLGIHHGSLHHMLRARVGRDVPRRRVIGLEDYVVAAMFRHLEEEEGMARIEAERVNPAVDLEPLEDAVRVARADLDAYAKAEGQIREAGGLEAYLAGLRARRERMDDAQHVLDDVLRKAARPDRPVREIREDWDLMTLEEQRDHLASVIQTVFVRQKTDSGASEGASPARVHIVWADEPEVDVPRQGRRDYALRPFVFPLDDADGPGLVGEAVA